MTNVTDADRLYFVSLKLSKRDGNQIFSSMGQHWGYHKDEETAIGSAVLSASELKPGFSVDQWLVACPDDNAARQPGYDRAIAEVVAWLRSNAMGGRWRELADAIEAGEHVKETH